MTQPYSPALLCTLGLLALVACNDDDATTSTNLESSRQLNTLSAKEAESACANVGKSFNGVLTEDYVCTLASMFGSSSKADCEKNKAECLALNSDDADSQESDLAPCLGAEDADSIMGCLATVGELEACANQALDVLKATKPKVTCDNAGNMEVLNSFSSSQTPACDALDTKCPSAD